MHNNGKEYKRKSWNTMNINGIYVFFLCNSFTYFCVCKLYFKAILYTTWEFVVILYPYANSWEKFRLWDKIKKNCMYNKLFTLRILLFVPYIVRHTPKKKGRNLRKPLDFSFFLVFFFGKKNSKIQNGIALERMKLCKKKRMKSKKKTTKRHHHNPKQST